MNLNKILKIVMIIAILLIAGSIFYYYVIFSPQKEKRESEQQVLNQQLLTLCLEETDNAAWKDFIPICKDDERISGGNIETCEMGTVEDTISYMHASYLRETLFKGVLEKREKAREECFKRYPTQ